MVDKKSKEDSPKKEDSKDAPKATEKKPKEKKKVAPVSKFIGDKMYEGQRILKNNFVEGDMYIEFRTAVAGYKIPKGEYNDL